MLDLRDLVTLSLTPRISRYRLAQAMRALWPAVYGDPSVAEHPHERHFRDEDGPGLFDQIGAPSVEALALLCRGSHGTEASLEAARAAAAEALSAAGRLGIEPVAWGDAKYPRQLAAIPDPPLVLWERGNAGALGETQVAVVGSRAASPYGLEVAERLAAELALHGLVVTSGLARGVDSAAHRGALRSNGKTVAVLGSGVDVVYPPEHASLADRIACHGSVVSEFAPGTPPRSFHFPQRNRIISGLSVAIVVVEASERSGALITAECGLEQGREVMAVPGSILNPRHRGSHALLRDGAAVVETAADVLAQIGFATAPAERAAGRTPAGEEDPVLRCMSAGEAYELERLAACCGLQPVALLARLAELELRGAVRRCGGRFVRSEGTC
jgi:DNA processing protein